MSWKQHNCLVAGFMLIGARMSHLPPTVSVSRSPMDGRLFLAYPHDSGALSQSFDKLQLMDDGGSDLVSVIG